MDAVDGKFGLLHINVYNESNVPNVVEIISIVKSVNPAFCISSVSIYLILLTPEG